VAESRKLYFLIKLIVEKHPEAIFDNASSLTRTNRKKERYRWKGMKEWSTKSKQNYELDIKNMIFIKSSLCTKGNKFLMQKLFSHF
jgi:hypothetical protein